MEVVVTTGSRLHFGLICGGLDSGWQFGGIGLMLKTPGWHMSFRTCTIKDAIVSYQQETGIRIQEFLSFMRQSYELPPLFVKVSSVIPFHTGLGGGTQLGLAIASAAEIISGRASTHDPWKLARLAHRAERSAIGTAGFRSGGFLVDRGQTTDSSEANRVQRISVPETWRFLLIRPTSVQGISGDRERQFFHQRVQMPTMLVTRLGQQIDQQIIPAVVEGDFRTFAEKLEEYGDAVGSFYASEQGDIFAHPVIRSLVRQLRSQGIVGAAQSSWGPGICIPAESQGHAESIQQRIPTSMNGTALLTSISEPLNIGATVRFTAPEGSERCFV